MATWDDVRRVALGLPNTSEGSSFGNLAWKVDGKAFVWQRPLRKSDLAALGDAAPDGPILGVQVEHEGIKHALIDSEPAVYFTTPHFNGYPAVLVRLAEIEVRALEELLQDAWLARAPKRLAKAYLSDR
jgi:hypothetical protein